MQVRDMMQKAGFTDIHVATGSLLIRAKDKDGNPVVMNVSPDSLTEVAEIGSGTGPGDSSGVMSDSRSGSEFVTVPMGGESSSNLVGLDYTTPTRMSVR